MWFAVAIALLGFFAAPVAPPAKVCVVTDSRAHELSGLVAQGPGYVSINDSQYVPSDTRIFYLDSRCKVVRTVKYPSAARDPEDLAIAPDGTLWVADIGDNVTADTRRSTVALWRVPSSGSPVIYRLTYPDGPHDAEALLFTADGQPLIITKEVSGAALLFQPTGPLTARTTAGVPMRAVGSFTPTATGIPNLAGQIGEVVITGAATSPDRRHVVLRTYTAAYEWDVPDGDVVKAITTGTPRVTDLPDEPQGEAIAYTPDGQAFLTVSDEAGPTTLRRYVPAARPSLAPPTTASPAPTAGARMVDLSLWYGVAAIVGGLILALVGFVTLRRRRGPTPSRR
jgi:hypothetical protein